MQFRIPGVVTHERRTEGETSVEKTTRGDFRQTRVKERNGLRNYRHEKGGGGYK